ncbi:MAG: alpha-N-acetylglucosaminidase [bacterium]|nr:alpha-N-acetylglucosaminidase [bacterium]
MKNKKITLLTKTILPVFALFFLFFPMPGRIPADTAGGRAVERAAQDLLKRLIPRHTQHFVFKAIPADNGKDVFEVQSRGGKILIMGNNGVSMASGLNWYLKNLCRCHISLNCSRLDLPEPLPGVKGKVRIISPFKYRNFFNYCTFGYTMAWWDWERWQRIIDYMALNGVNMPLAVTGQEAVWQQVYEKLGLKPRQILDFITGPAYLPWGWMGNIDGLGGPLPQNWIDRHTGLQQKILERERALGMTPILQGFTGHVPAAVKELFPDAELHRTTDWAGMPGTWFLDPQDPLFLEIGKTFIKKQTELYGTDHLYNADCFNEINPHTDDPAFITGVGKSVYEAMAAADEEAVWVFQGWFLHFQPDFWKTAQARALLTAVPDDRMMGLDLWGEKNPVWNKTNAFYGKPWVWNVFCSRSQKVNMGGDLDSMQRNLAEVLESKSSGKIRGMGMMMEGMGYNPVVQEFILEKTWNPERVDIREWVADYACRRYGCTDPRLEKVWQLLLEGPYSLDVPDESIICSIPRLRKLPRSGGNDGNDAEPRDLFRVGYDAHTVAEACGLMLECVLERGPKPAKLAKLETFRFDLVHVTREMLNNLANRLNRDITAAYIKKDADAVAERGKIFLQLIRDMDELLGTNRHFLLGKWIADARKWGTGDKEKNVYESNARAIVTMWEPAKESKLRDYASKQWNGLLNHFYLPRWERFLDELHKAMTANKRLKKKKILEQLKEMELNWIYGKYGPERYPSEPDGDSLQTAHRLYKKYIKYYKTSGS